MSKVTIDRSVVEQALEAMDDMASDSRLLSMSPTRIRMFDCARDELRAALEQPDHSEQHLDMVLDGWKLVPVEPTEKMVRAPWGKVSADGDEAAIYRTMLSAAPQPPTTEQSSAVEQEPVRWPANASEVRAFLSGRVAAERYARDDHQPDDNDTYTLSAHDLLEAIDWWTDFDPQPKREPLTDEEITEITFKLLNEGASMHDFARAIERAHGIGGEA